MNLAKYLAAAWRIILLKGDAAVEVSRDGSATFAGIVVVAITGVLLGLASLLYGPVQASFVEIFVVMCIAAAIMVCFSFVFTGILHALARLFGGRASFIEYYRPVALASITAWARLVPMIGFFLALWAIPVNIVIIEKVHGLTRRRSIIVFSIFLLGLLVLQSIFLVMVYKNLETGGAL